MIAVTEETGNLVEQQSYDPHGRRRNNVGWVDYAVVVSGGETDRGFTGHEHLDDVGLIHMNGRIQDPRLGRFLSPDPFVPDPTDSQSFNRYSYVRNNPLSRVDPSGFYDGHITLERAPNGSIVVGAGGTSINVGFGPQRWEFRDYALYVHAREWWLEGVRNRARRLETERLAREAAVTPPEIVAPISYVAPWRGFNQIGISTTTTRFSLSAPYVPQTGFVGGEATRGFARLGREILNLTGYGPDVPTGELIINGTLDALSFFPGAAAVMQPIKWGRIAKRLKKAFTLEDTGKPVKEGIYEFVDTTGKKYCGQSCNIPERLKQHVKSGKLDPEQNVITTEVLGGKTAREVAEHKRIQEITGGVPARFSTKVSNKVDPIGPKRRHLLDE